MNRRLVVATLTLGLLATGVAGSALASTATTRHKVCVTLLGSDPSAPNQQGYCVSWDDPSGVVGR